MTPRPLHVLAVVLVAAAVAARKYEILGQLESSAPDQVRQNPACDQPQTALHSLCIEKP